MRGKSGVWLNRGHSLQDVIILGKAVIVLVMVAAVIIGVVCLLRAAARPAAALGSRTVSIERDPPLVHVEALLSDETVHPRVQLYGSLSLQSQADEEPGPHRACTLTSFGRSVGLKCPVDLLPRVIDLSNEQRTVYVTVDRATGTMLHVSSAGARRTRPPSSAE